MPPRKSQWQWHLFLDRVSGGEINKMPLGLMWRIQKGAGLQNEGDDVRVQA